MALLILSFVLVSFITFLAYIFYSRREHFKLRQKVGLEGPETHWFLGNLKEIIE